MIWLLIIILVLGLHMPSRRHNTTSEDDATVTDGPTMMGSGRGRGVGREEGVYLDVSP